jgi:putative transcriptional regulator
VQFTGLPRSKFGKWLDKQKVSQSDLSRISGIPISTISALVRGESESPTRLTEKKLRKAIKEIDPNMDSNDFWNI